MKQYKILNVAQIVTALIIFTFLLLLTIYKPLNQDEGVFLAIGKFLHFKTLPYRDIFDHKPPGIYFLNYLLFGITSNLIFVKIVFATINLLSAILITRIYCSISDKPHYKYLPAIFFLILLIIFEGNYLVAEIPMIFCLLLALNFALHKIKNYFLIGFFCSLAIIFKQTALISSLLIIIFSIIKYKNDVLKIILGFSLPIIILFFYLGINKIMMAGLEQIIWLNLCCYPREPIFSVLKSLSFYFIHSLPILFFAIFQILFIAKNNRSKRNMIIIVLLALLPIPFLLIRHYPHYFLQVIPFIALLASLGAERLLAHCRHSREGGNQEITTRITGLYSQTTSLNPKVIRAGDQLLLNFKSILLKLIILASIALMLVSNFRWFSWQFTHNYIQQYRDQYRVISYLNRNNLTEIITENQFSFFSILNNKPQTKYLYITEINNKDEQAEEETIQSLKQNKNIVVLWPTDQRFAYAKKLQQYVLENYLVKVTFPEFGLAIYSRK